MSESAATVQPQPSAVLVPRNEKVITAEITSVSTRLHDFIRERMESFKCSAHDAAHVYRVANLTAQIAAKVPKLRFVVL